MKPPQIQSAPLPTVLEGRSVVILGAGRVGSAVGALLGQAGLPIVAITTRGLPTARQAASLSGGEPGTDNAAAAVRGDIVLVTTNDDSTAAVVAEVAAAGGFRPGQLVIHMSGAQQLDVLAPAAQSGALVGCAHPMQSFATAQHAMGEIPGSVFGVTAGPGARDVLDAFVHVLGGHPVEVADDNKALYHAAGVMASNYLVAVEDVAAALLMDAGFDEATAMRALAPLIRGTANNIVELGTTRALTGPIVRGDVDTVRANMEALQGASDDRLALYKMLGRRTLAIAQRRGSLDADQVAELERLLEADPAFSACGQPARRQDPRE